MGTDRELLGNPTLCMVNYNGEKYLEESLGSVFLQKETFIEILLIDNASEDRSLEIVSHKFPTVKVIKLNKNAGPAVARNVGFREACSDLILFMDNDVSLAPECADNLLKALNDNPRAAVATPRVLYANNKNVIQFDGADCHFLGLMTLHNVNRSLEESTNEPGQSGSLVTACFLLDRSKLENTDPFDNSFFFNYEDHDFGIRISGLGLYILSVPSALCYHREGTEGLSLRHGGKYSKIRVYNLIRNRWIIILKNYDLRTMVLLAPMFVVYEIFQIGGVLKKGWFLEWLRALFWVILHPVEILRKRRTVQRMKRTRDREILIDGPIPFRDQNLPRSVIELKGKRVLDLIAKAYWNKVARFV